ncbi:MULTISPECIES: FliA/WhiG family RNA polymerase sigma factor [Bacillaceae]|uniref:RNA polymerase subunit sigma n=1 Tax=Pseudobacillus wudalianchiensis TaxID=1743143 RepID=A0A1B9AIY4_9BACI|nr:MULTISPECIES: FliA/WhiG family RNA polymerase sigma factor [Bacillus]KMY53638.1 RNA polymerase sigma factor SigD [Bacillus sp. FJAT-27231]OCA83814.1 RNA polymerase subunit sigma [Bacillus wudalianchiensis]
MAKQNRYDEQKLWAAWKASEDPEAGNLLVEKYMPLVSFHSQRIAASLPKSVNKEDIKSLGLMGLYDALKKFDPARDLKFDTYASFRIRGAILDGLRKEDWLPRGTREKAKKIEAKIEELEQKHLRRITAAEVAEQLDIPEEEVHQTMTEHLFSNVLSMDEQVHDNEDSEGKSFVLKDDKADLPEDVLVKGELVQELTGEIAKLSEKEQLVLSLFYHEELTLTEIGEVMNLSTSRISQIHSKALFKLKNQLIKINGPVH